MFDEPHSTQTSHSLESVLRDAKKCCDKIDIFWHRDPNRGTFNVIVYNPFGKFFGENMSPMDAMIEAVFKAQEAAYIAAGSKKQNEDEKPIGMPDGFDDLPASGEVSTGPKLTKLGESWRNNHSSGSTASGFEDSGCSGSN